MTTILNDIWIFEDMTDSIGIGTLVTVDRLYLIVSEKYIDNKKIIKGVAVWR